MEGNSDKFRVESDSEDEFLMVETGSASDKDDASVASSVKESSKDQDHSQTTEPDSGKDEEVQKEEEEEVQEEEEEDMVSNCPGDSEFAGSECSDNGSEWDAFSQKGGETAAWFLQEAGKAFLNAVASSNEDLGAPAAKSTLICEGTKLLSQLERALREQTASHAEAGSEETEAESADLGELWRVFQQEHVVQAVQSFLAQPVVTKCVMDFAKQGKLQLESVKGIGANHFGDLLSALGDLIKLAPELLSAVPLTLEKLFQWCEGNRADSTAAPSCEEEKEEKKKTEEEEEVSSKVDAPVVHSHVLCDGCTTDDQVEASRAAGNRVGNYIAGVRWKSAIIEDFDLCSTCEQTGNFEEKYGPFLKITHPKKSPRQLIVVLKDSREPVVPTRRYRGRRRTVRDPSSLPMVPPMGGIPVGVQVSPPVAAAPVAPAAEETAEDAAPSSSMSCPANHPLVQFTPSSAYTCDVCEARSCVDKVMFGCRACDWDMCQTCASAQKFPVATEQPPASNAQPAAVNRLGFPAGARVMFPGGCRAVKASEVQSVQQAVPPVERASRPQAKFISDVSLSDGSLVERNGAIVKTWRIQNSGKARWPEGVRLVCVGGERMEGSMNGVVVPPLEPAMFYNISVHLVAPGRPGRYVGYWRLMTPEPNQQRFGHRLWVDVTVKEEEEERSSSKVLPAAAEENGPQEEIRDWSGDLQRLVDMGFLDCDRNLELLQQENGNVEKVISTLLQ